MSTLIKEPDGTKNLKHIQNLQVFMSRTHKTPNRFSYFLVKCRRWSKHLKLPRNKFSHEQDPALWKAYVGKMCSVDKPLSEYEGHWPIRVYFDLRVALYLAGKYLGRGQPAKATHPEKRVRTTAAVPPSPLAMITPSPPDAPRATKPLATAQPQPREGHKAKRRLFIGKPPPGVRHATNIRALTVSPTPEPVQPPPVRPPRMQEQDGSDDELTTAPCSDLPWKSKVQKPPRHPRIKVVYVRCYDCGRALGREFAGPTPKLRALLGDDDELFNILFEAGLVSDRHLAIFLGWSHEQREYFLDLISTSPFTRQALKSKLLPARSLKVERQRELKVTWVEEVLELEADACPRPTKQGFCGVLQPPPELEEQLTDPKQPIELLFRAMSLGDNETLFNDIVTLVEKGAEAYTLTYHPSREQFEGVVKAVFQERIVFERYENEWPIRFILKRIARKLGNKPLDDHLTASPPSKNSTPKKPKPRVQTPPSCLKDSPPPSIRISYTCPIHPGVDIGQVSQKIHGLLHNRGLAELLPVFAMVGIRTEGHVQQFCAFSSEEKDAVLHDCRQRPLNLNAFQELALKIEFTTQMFG